jgi:serine phosphatase RsbU (regulator of sigma subunit)
LQQSQWPQPIRLIEEGWELAGRCDSASELGGAFYDWLWLPGDALAVMIGEASQTGIAGALTAATIRSALRTLTEQGLSPDEALSKINRSLWFTSGGDETATLLFGIIELSSGRVRYSWAGQPSAIRTSANAAPVPLAARPPLGATTDALFTVHSLDSAPAESLVICTRMIDATGGAFKGRKIDSSAIELVESLAGLPSDSPVPRIDRALVAMKRLV